MDLRIISILDQNNIEEFCNKYNMDIKDELDFDKNDFIINIELNEIYNFNNQKFNVVLALNPSCDYESLGLYIDFYKKEMEGN